MRDTDDEMLSETECFHFHSYIVETINVFDQYIGFQETFLRTSCFMHFTFLCVKNDTTFLFTVHWPTVSMACSIKEFARS